MRSFMLIVEKAQNPMSDPAFRAWFQGSHVVDGAGQPLVVYRGEHGDHAGASFHTRLGSLSFGTQNAANSYALSPNDRNDDPVASRVYPCYLAIKNPAINDPDDPFIDLSTISKLVGRDKARIVAIDLADYITHTNNWQEDVNADDKYTTPVEAFDAGEDLYLNAYPVFDDPEYVAWFEAAGFDGAIHGGTGETACEPEYKIFDASQARPAI